jgi:TRAP-type C4-dicarboxylate transport system substrate-binding protein
MRTHTILLLTSLSIMFSQTTFSQSPIVIKMGNVIGDSNSDQMPLHTGNIQKIFSKKVNEYTKGQIVWEILDGKRPDIPVFMMPSMTSKGDIIQATTVPSLFMPKVPEIKIQSIPFLFGNDEHSNAVSINSTTPIRKPKDFEGKNLNDFSDSWTPMWSRIKPNKITYIGYNEAAAGALVDGDVETEINIGMLQNNHSQRLYERYKHLTIAPNMYNIYYTVLINNDVWNGLTAFQKDGINLAMIDAQRTSIAQHMDTMMHALALNQSEGVDIHFLTSNERNKWKEEFYPKILQYVIMSSSDPEKTIEMVEKIKSFIADLNWK